MCDMAKPSNDSGPSTRKSLMAAGTHGRLWVSKSPSVLRLGHKSGARSGEGVVGVAWVGSATWPPTVCQTRICCVATGLNAQPARIVACNITISIARRASVSAFSFCWKTGCPTYPFVCNATKGTLSTRITGRPIESRSTKHYRY